MEYTGPLTGPLPKRLVDSVNGVIAGLRSAPLVGPLAGFLRKEDPQRLRDQAGDRAVVVEFELCRDGGLTLHAEAQAADGL